MGAKRRPDPLNRFVERSESQANPKPSADSRRMFVVPNADFTQNGKAPDVRFRTVEVNGLDVFYREAGTGRGDAPAILLLHGFPDQLAHVPQPDPGTGGRVPRRRPGLPWLRPKRDAAAGQVRLHLRQPGRRRREVHRPDRADEVRPVRAGLRRPGRLPAGRRSTRTA